MKQVVAFEAAHVSAHKWLHQPKESALVLFADTDAAHRSISFGAPYLAAPNVGLLGSRGYTALPLAVTLLAYGLDGSAGWVGHEMGLTKQLVTSIDGEEWLRSIDANPPADPDRVIAAVLDSARAART